MSFADKALICRDCSGSFVFTAGEQEFYASKGLQNEPVRCPSCRAARKNARTNEVEDGYVRYGAFASFGGRTPRQMHPATCAECGMMTEVPFVPQRRPSRLLQRLLQQAPRPTQSRLRALAPHRPASLPVDAASAATYT